MFELLAIVGEAAVYNEHFVRAYALLGAGIAAIAGLGTGLGQGIAAGHAASAVGKQPEKQSKITITMIVGQAMAETSALYGLLIAILLMFVAS